MDVCDACNINKTRTCGNLDDFSSSARAALPTSLHGTRVSRGTHARRLPDANDDAAFFIYLFYFIKSRAYPRFGGRRVRSFVRSFDRPIDQSINRRRERVSDSFFFRDDRRVRARARSSRRDGWLTDANENSDENGIRFYFESVRSFVRSVVRPSVDRVRGSVRSVDRSGSPRRRRGGVRA